MRICFFGSYNKNYPRNKILFDALKKNGAQIKECHCSKGSFLTRYPSLILKFLPIKNKVDLIFVGFPGHLEVPIALLLAKITGKKLVFDVFYSLYDTYVFDRQSTKSGTFRAWSFWFIDKMAMTLPDLVICDTWSHADYFSKTFALPKTKFKRLLLGADDRIFRPSSKKNNTKYVTVEFHGMFARLHGAEFFIQAAKILEKYEKIKFILIGGENRYSYPMKLLNQLKPKNLRYLGILPPKKVCHELQKADISVGGHFGLTNKANNVISNKTFEALACKKAVIVGKTKANAEIFRDKENALFVKRGDPNDLAKKILLLYRDKRLREQIATQGYHLFQQKLANKVLGKELVTILKNSFSV